MGLFDGWFKSEPEPKKDYEKILRKVEQYVYRTTSDNPRTAHIDIADMCTQRLLRVIKDKYKKDLDFLPREEQIEYYEMIKKVLDENKGKPVAQKLINAVDAHAFALGLTL